MQPNQLMVPYTDPSGNTRMVKGTLVEDIDAVDVPWCKYKLKDGTIIRTKQILTQLVYLDGEKLANGDQAYLCQFQPVVTIIPPIDSKE